MANRFNLVEEKWIPTASGVLSLNDIFSDGIKSRIGYLIGTPLEKISLFRFLLAVAQSAFTPKNKDEWLSLDREQFCKEICNYLSEKRDLFWLFSDERPFLQIRDPSDELLKKQKTTHLLKLEASDNMVITSDLQQTPDSLSDVSKAILLFVVLNFSLAHKKWSPDGRRPIPPSHTIGRGYLHINILGEDLIESLMLNILSEEEILNMKFLPLGIGSPVWEYDISFQNIDKLNELRKSYLGRLLPLSRFIRFLQGSEEVWLGPGVVMYNKDNLIIDPFWIIAKSKKGEEYPKKVDPEKGITRDLPAMLEYSRSTELSSLRSFILDTNLQYIRNKIDSDYFGFYVGGIKSSMKSGGEYISGSDDWIDSKIIFPKSTLQEDSGWLDLFKGEIKWIEDKSNLLENRVKKYWRDNNVENANDIAKKASSEFWKTIAVRLQDIVYALQNSEKIASIRQDINRIAVSIYNEFCPKEAPRQLELWVKNAWFI